MPIHSAEDAASGTAILTLRGPLSWSDYAAALGPMIALRDRLIEGALEGEFSRAHHRPSGGTNGRAVGRAA